MYCSKLEVLDLSNVSVTQASFKQLTQSCTRLRVSRHDLWLHTYCIVVPRMTKFEWLFTQSRSFEAIFLIPYQWKRLKNGVECVVVLNRSGEITV